MRPQAQTSLVARPLGGRLDNSLTLRQSSPCFRQAAPRLRLRGLERSVLTYPAARPCIGLQNSADGFVVSGRPESVARVCGVLSDTVKDANGQTPKRPKTCYGGWTWKSVFTTPPCCPPWRKWPNGRQPAVWTWNRHAASRTIF